MQIPQDVDAFRDLLSRASGRIGKEYFMLPVADTDGGLPLIQYRERVYAYEMYHQLRSEWPQWGYSLGGEIDKRGHPIVRGGDLDNVKPDLLVHVPGAMDENLSVIEIKAAGPEPPASERTAIETDLKKLAAFCGFARYQVGVLLIFGEHVDRISGHAAWVQERGVQLNRLELWHHAAPGQVATRIRWR